MKPAFATIALLGCGLVCDSPAAAQSALSGTYYGWDGPPGAGGENYLANIDGGAIEILPRGDQCGRPFYIQGVMTALNPQGRGSLDGVMLRCTNPELFACDHLIHYEISVRGQVQLDASTRRLYLNLSYTMEIWNKDTCKKEREEQRTEMLQLLYQPPTPPPPTTTQAIDGIFDDVKQIVIDGILYLGGGPPH